MAAKTQQERREESERKLTDALIHIINTEGINAATCSKIGAEAGVSRGLASHRLGNREEMIVNLIESLKKKQIESLLEQTQGLDAPACLRKYIDIHFHDLTTNPGYQAYFVLAAASIAVSPALKEHIQSTHEFIRDTLANFIREGQQQGMLKTDADADISAAVIGAYLFGAAMQFHVSGRDVGVVVLKPGAYALVSEMAV